MILKCINPYHEYLLSQHELFRFELRRVKSIIIVYSNWITSHQDQWGWALTISLRFVLSTPWSSITTKKSARFTCSTMIRLIHMIKFTCPGGVSIRVKMYIIYHHLVFSNLRRVAVWSLNLNASFSRSISIESQELGQKHFSISSRPPGFSQLAYLQELFLQPWFDIERLIWMRNLTNILCYSIRGYNKI